MAILRGDPSRAYPYIYRILKESGGNLLAVTAEEIIEAKERLKKLESIDACFSASTAVAGLIKSAIKVVFQAQKR